MQNELDKFFATFIQLGVLKFLHQTDCQEWIDTKFDIFVISYDGIVFDKYDWLILDVSCHFSHSLNSK